MRDLTATLAARSLEKPRFITSYHFQRHCVISFRKKLNVQYKSFRRDSFHSVVVLVLAKTRPACYRKFSTVSDKFSTTGDYCPWKINSWEAMSVSLRECRNLPVSSYTGTLIAKDKELKSKLGLWSTELNKFTNTWKRFKVDSTTPGYCNCHKHS